MSDIDDELLALAGGGSDGEVSVRSSPRPSKRRRSRSPGKTRHALSDEEEGEARDSAPGSPNSQASAPMDESDSDASVASRGSISRSPLLDREYPFEGLYRSAAEKRKIMALVEVERESILADRRNEMQTYRQNKALAQMAAKRPGGDADKRGKRGGDSMDLDESDEEAAVVNTRRSKTAGKMDEYRRTREAKSDRRRKFEEEGPSGRSRYDDGDDNMSDHGDRRRRSPTPDKKQSGRRDVVREDLERLRIGRSGFSQICFKPRFEDTVVGCYVRVMGKPDKSTGKAQYHLLSIKGITTGKPYALPDQKSSQPTVTDQYIMAGIGKKTETYPFIAISDGRLDEHEFQNYKDSLYKNNLSLPRAAVLDDRLAALNALVNYQLNNQEITDMVERKTQLRRRVDPAQREALQRAIAEAEEGNNPILARQLQEDLEALGTATGLAFRGSGSYNKDQGTGAHMSQQEKLAELNRINRRKNVDNVRRAQLKEKMRVRELEAKAARGEVVVEDLSRRLKTKAKFVHDVTEQESGISKKDEFLAGVKKGTSGKEREAQKSIWIGQRVGQGDGVALVHRPITDDDVIASLDLGIVVDL